MKRILFILLFLPSFAKAQISVTATAGTLGPTTYTTLHAAFNAINAGTHQGAINISITTSGTITEPSTDTLMSSGAGPASYTSVLIKPAAGVTATIRNNVSTTNATIFLYGAANVTIDGSNIAGGTTQNLTIENNTGTSSVVIRFGTPNASIACSNDTVKNCIIPSTTNGLAAIISGGTTVGSAGLAPTARITIQNNKISGGPGVNANGPAIMDTAWTITGNTMTGFWNYAITITNGFNPVISNNTITGYNTGGAGGGVTNNKNSIDILISAGQNAFIYGNTITGVQYGALGGSFTTASSPPFESLGIEITNGQGVVIDSNNISGAFMLGTVNISGPPGVWMITDIYINGGNAITISNNTINGPTSWKMGTAPVAGIQLSNVINGANVYNNKVSGINNPAAHGAYGIYISASNTGNNINVYNNFVSAVVDSVGGTVRDMGHGIYMDQGDGVNIYHNTLNQSAEQHGAYPGCPGSAGICFDPTGGSGVFSNINVVDNIIVNTQTMGSPYSIFSGAPNSVFTTIDYNDYYAPNGNMGNIGGTNLNTIANMQAGFGGNVHSITFSPLFVGANNLHLQAGSSNSALNAGIFITSPSITTDIDKDPRSVPTIGADELISCPVHSITGATTLCAGSTITLSDATTGGTWSSGNTTIATVSGSGDVSGVGAGTANISYTVGSCSVSVSVTVTTLPAITPATATVCAGSMTALSDATTGGTWSSSSTAIATVSGTGIVTGVSAGTVSIFYSSGGCSVSATVTVSGTLAAITGATNICPGSTITLSDATTGGTWSSSNTAIATVSGTSDVSGVTAGTANISYTVGSCSVSVSVTVGALPAITGATAICTGSVTQLSDAAGGGIWSSDNTFVATVSGTGAVSGVTTGTANISYTVGSCSASVTVTVTTLAALTPATATLCAGSMTALSDATTGGVWSSSNTAIATVTGSGAVTGAGAGTAVISYTIAGCSAAATVTVTPLPNAGTITGPPGVCAGATINLSDAAAGGVWSSTSTGVATVSANGIVRGISAGTTTISYTVTNSCGTAAAVKIITVSLFPAAGTITGDTSVCAGSTIALSNNAAGGVWSSGATGIAAITPAAVVTGITAGSATISYTVTNSCGSASAIKNIAVYPLPPISPITGEDSACPNAVFTLSDATPGGRWTNTNVMVAAINAATGLVYAYSEGVTTIIYTTGPTANGCISTATFTLTVTDQGTFIIDSIVSPVKCYGANNGSISVTIRSGASQYQYLWSNGDNGPSTHGLPPGYDTLSIKEEATQCLAVVTFHITQPDSLSVTSVSENDLCNEGTGSIRLDAAGGSPPYSYSWSNSAASKNITALRAGVYSVSVTDSNHCIKTHSAVVNNDTCSDIVIHDAITPNGDGINDTWVIEHLGVYPSNTVQVFDKWGDLVYEKTNYNNDWAGSGKSGLLPDGTYYYLVKLNAQNLKGGKNTFTGTLLIKR